MFPLRISSVLTIAALPVISITENCNLLFYLRISFFPDHSYNYLQHLSILAALIFQFCTISNKYSEIRMKTFIYIFRIQLIQNSIQKEDSVSCFICSSSKRGFTWSFTQLSCSHFSVIRRRSLLFHLMFRSKETIEPS